jgi:acetyltransferase-like isoleucine patch superfamily enzyme
LFKYKTIVSLKVKYKNNGKIISIGPSHIGFCSNYMNLDVKASGVFRVYKTGTVVLNPFVRISRTCKVYVSGILEIGQSTYINPNTLIIANHDVKIGANCAISWNVQIIDDDFHSINKGITKDSIIIGDKVWIGSDVKIIKGAKIGSGSVIAANSLVVGEVPPNSLVGGIPAKVLKSNIVWS